MIHPYVPRLFELGPITVYTYGVLLAAAYLLGLQLARIPRAEARPRSEPHPRPRIYIIISALIGAKLLLLITDFKTFTADPRELFTLRAIRRRLLWRVDSRRRRGALVHPAHRSAALDHVRRVRAGNRARPRRGALRLSVCRLLLRQADDQAVGVSRSPIRSRPRT